MCCETLLMKTVMFLAACVGAVEEEVGLVEVSERATAAADGCGRC